jgi:serine/threonine protein phosphatase PrpC
VRDDRLVCANVGDSRALLIRKGRGVELTADHRPVGTSSKGRQEMQRVVNAGGWSVGGRVCGILAVSRAFGDYEFKGGRFDLLEGESFLIIVWAISLTSCFVYRSERGTLGEEGDVERSARGADAGCARDSTRGRQRRVAGEFFLIGNWTV